MRDQGSAIGDQGHGPATPRKKRTWILVVIGILFVMFCIAVGAIIFTVSYFRDNVQVTRDVSDSGAVDAFAAARAKFPGQQPVVQLIDGHPQVVPQTSRPNAGKPVTSLHVLAFDRNSGEMVRFTLPFWLLRMKSGPIRLSAYSQGWDDRGVSFDIKELEAAGPGIVVDIDREREGRMLIWAE
ncbi:MAG TPA: hypothetical protein VNT81_20900 [Vicinamibacterales bacterium]|nr:hypothetical protein [Vicinamibacterales bacterium]